MTAHNNEHINPVDVIEEFAPYVFPGFEINKESFDDARKVLDEPLADMMIAKHDE